MCLCQASDAFVSSSNLDVYSSNKNLMLIEWEVLFVPPFN